MSEEIKEDLQNYLRASSVVEAINATLPEGLPKLPSLSDIQLRALNRDAAGVALMATYEALGGIPGMVAWAASDPKNAGKVYEWFIKQIPTQANVEHSGNLTVVGALGDSPFDEYDVGEDEPRPTH